MLSNRNKHESMPEQDSLDVVTNTRAFGHEHLDEGGRMAGNGRRWWLQTAFGPGYPFHVGMKGPTGHKHVTASAVREEPASAALDGDACMIVIRRRAWLSLRTCIARCSMFDVGNVRQTGDPRMRARS